jgi:hypothetical protein
VKSRTVFLNRNVHHHYALSTRFANVLADIRADVSSERAGTVLEL